jgi:hypothetical protein
MLQRDRKLRPVFGEGGTDIDKARSGPLDCCLTVSCILEKNGPEVDASGPSLTVAGIPLHFPNCVARRTARPHGSPVESEADRNWCATAGGNDRADRAPITAKSENLRDPPT